MQVLVHLVVIGGTHLLQQAEAARLRELILALLHRIFFKLLNFILYLWAIHVVSIILRSSLRFKYLLTFMHSHMELLLGKVLVLLQWQYLRTFR